MSQYPSYPSAFILVTFLGETSRRFRIYHQTRCSLWQVTTMFWVDITRFYYCWFIIFNLQLQGVYFWSKNLCPVSYPLRKFPAMFIFPSLHLFLAKFSLFFSGLCHFTHLSSVPFIFHISTLFHAFSIFFFIFFPQIPAADTFPPRLEGARINTMY